MDHQRAVFTISNHSQCGSSVEAGLFEQNVSERSDDIMPCIKLTSPDPSWIGDWPIRFALPLYLPAEGMAMGEGSKTPYQQAAGKNFRPQ